MSPSPEPRQPKPTPFLCRVFVKAGPYHPIEAFQEPHTLPLSDEYGVYAWKTSTLSTLLASLYPSLPAPLQNPGCKYSFRSVYFDARALQDDHRDRDRERGSEAQGKGRPWKYRELGRIDGRDLIRDGGNIQGAKTMEEHRYQPGDYLCLSIHVPAPAQHQPDHTQHQHQQPMAMRINPRAPLPPSLAGQGMEGRSDATSSWIDARNSQQRGGRGGGFGIRGRGAAAPQEITPRNDSSSGNGNGNGKGGDDDGWGAVRDQQGTRRSASPMRGTRPEGW